MLLVLCLLGRLGPALAVGVLAGIVLLGLLVLAERSSLSLVLGLTFRLKLVESLSTETGTRVRLGRSRTDFGEEACARNGTRDKRRRLVSTGYAREIKR